MVSPSHVSDAIIAMRMPCWKIGYQNLGFSNPRASGIARLIPMTIAAAYAEYRQRRTRRSAMAHTLESWSVSNQCSTVTRNTELATAMPDTTQLPHDNHEGT